jgi:hypothetical protein
LVPNGGQADGQTGHQADGQSVGQSVGQQEQEQEQEFKNPLTPLKGGGELADGKSKKRSKEEKANSVPSAYGLDFEKFWAAYPRRPGGRGGKDAAWKVWQRRAKAGTLPAASELMAAIEKLVKSDAWLKDGGQFIPMATTFLNQGRWSDAEDLQIQDTPTKNSVDPNCPICRGRGFVDAEIDGEQGQADCECRRRNYVS